VSAGSRPLRIALLGATGSIGRQSMEVIDRYPDRFEIFGLVAGRRTPGRPARYVVQSGDPDAEARVEEMVTHPDCDLVLVAIAGSQALRPTLAALAAHKRVALATKEVLVMAGHLVMRHLSPGALRPIDSEHSAIWQCLWGESWANVRRLVLTASGGPFWAQPNLDLDSITVEQALNHPRWSMGPKVTVDSATLMNKALELIEAHHLFQLPLERIEVVIHPQSIVHSVVEFIDGSMKAQLGNPDMRLPIAVALAYPDRLPGVVPPTELDRAEPLEFHALDAERFRAVRLARQALAAGAPYPAVLNAANEEAVQGFLAGDVSFGDIVELVEAALSAHAGGGETLEEIYAADAAARRYIRMKSRSRPASGAVKTGSNLKS
jgi:1-deoxy-D-xylulose-5-phosphate reductoisomerase